MGHVETILNFGAETYCCNTAAKSKRFDFAALFQQHFFILQTVKIFLKPSGAAGNFFLALSMKHIALQGPEKCCKCPLSLTCRLN